MIGVTNIRNYDRTTENFPVIYVGRRIGQWQGHPLANPFKLPKKADWRQRVLCIRQYYQWLKTLPDRVRLLNSLKTEAEENGFDLGCWCCNWDGQNEPPTPCHACILARIVNEMIAGNGVEEAIIAAKEIVK